MKKLLFILLIFVCKVSFAITPIFCCGFECGNINLNGVTEPHFWVADASLTAWSFSTTTVRSGARTIRYNPSASNQTLNGYAINNTTTKVWRVYIRFATLPNADCIISYTNYSGSLAGIGYKNSDTKLYSIVKIAGVNTFGATGVTVTTGIWYRVDVKTVGSVVTGTCDIQVDGTACGQATGAFVGATSISHIFGSDAVNITADIFFDDYIMSETSADYPIGGGFVNHFVAISDGAPDHNVAGAADFRRGGTTTDITNATTTAYQLIDKVPLDPPTAPTDDQWIRIVAPPNVTDYVAGVFGPASGISTPTTGPRAVEIIAEFFAAGTLASDEILKLNDNGTVDDIYNGTGVNGTITGIYKRKHYATAPSTGTAWTAALFNGLKYRYGFATDANPDKSLMGVMIEAEFEPQVAKPRRVNLITQKIIPKIKINTK